MDTNNWRPTAPGGEPVMDMGDWRTQLQPDERQRMVNKIMDTLKRHLPFSGQERLQELKKIAVRFEEKIYTDATNQSDYLHKISLKMHLMEPKSQNTIPSGNANKPLGPEGGEPVMDMGDWKTQLQPDERQRMVNKKGITRTQEIAARFEEKIYTAATNPSDYLRKKSLKMLLMELKSQNTIPTANANKPLGPGGSDGTAG